ncbi:MULTISPECIES: YlcI/YnfO family protein [Enterobacterales]|uniref:YlcI/YnfO family protein n=1 Tax=Enterobacterales TaxID=91347 RepID=UPI002ED7E9B2
MASTNKNAKSQLFTVRVPHEVVSDMESSKKEGESSAGFIVTAMQGEIARRQLRQNGEDKLLTNLNGALEALERIEEIGTQAGEQLRELVGVAQSEAQQLKGGK